MKFNIFKYIFILFIIGIIIFTIYMIYFKKDNKQNEQNSNEIEEVVEEIKDLRLGVSNFDTINPLLTNNKEVLNIDKLIFEPLMTLDENYKLQLCLATECSKISDTSYVVKINNNTKWQDGSPLIAKDIQFTIDRLKEGKSIYSYNVEKVIGVEIVDADTVKINLSEPVPFFEYNLTFPILPNNYYMGEDFNTSSKIPMGTGMYKIESMDSSTIVLTKNDRWRKSKDINSKIEKITIKLYSEMGELYNSFKLGNIDVFTTENTNLTEYIGTIGYTKTEFKGREFDYLAFNCADDILKNKEVRNAIYYSINKANIVSSVYNNQYYISDFPLDYGNYIYNKELKTDYYNIDQSKQILVSDGWEFKNSRWQKKEKWQTYKLNLTLTVNSSNQKRVQVAENIKAQLAQLGINITVKKVSDEQYKKAIENKNYQMILTGVYNSYTPNIEKFLGNDNLQNYTNEEINNLLKEAKETTDSNVIKEKYQKILEIYESERPFIGLYRNKVIIVKGQTVAGETKGNNYFSYYNLENWHRF